MSTTLDTSAGNGTASVIAECVTSGLDSDAYQQPLPPLDKANRDAATTATSTASAAAAAEIPVPTNPLIKLTLKNITYRPLTKQYNSSDGKKRCSFFRSPVDTKKNDDSDASRSSRRPNNLSRKTILNNVSPPTVEPYTLQGWMGPSGSGKTTLLSIAAGLIPKRSSNDNFDVQAFTPESDMRVNNERVSGVGNATNSQPFPKRLVGVVWQDDLLLSNLTVRETIEFAARLKSPPSTNKQLDCVDSFSKLVDDLLIDLGLEHVQHSLIGTSSNMAGGGAGRGISGGERKRVSVAQELVTRPPLIFLDEPTSGLDSSSALALMRTLKSLAVKGGHAVVAVVHQPRTTIFELLDGLLLLSKGDVVYSGPPRGARAVLESCPVVGYSLPDQTNVADWIMDLISTDEGRASQGLSSRCPSTHSSRKSGGNGKSNDSDIELGDITGRMLPLHWLNVQKKMSSDIATTTNDELANPKQCNNFSSLALLEKSLPSYTTNFTTQLRLLTTRDLKQRRGERLTSVAFMVSAAYTVFETIFWFRLPDDTNHVYSRNSLLFFLIIAQANGVVMTSMLTFQKERGLLARERAKKMYRVVPYFLAKTISDMTATVLLPTLHAMIVYWTANLNPTAASYFRFIIFFYLTLSTAQSMGLVISVAIPSMEVAMMITPVLTIFLIILGGFYIPLSNFPLWLRWATWLSFAQYGYSGFVVNEYSGRDIPCAAEGISIGIGVESGVCPLPGSEIPISLGITGVSSHAWFNIIMLVAMQCSLRFVAYALLRRAR